MTDIIERLRGSPFEWLADEIAQRDAEIVRLKEQVATCRELRKFDRIEIERMRILIDRKTEG